jgi:vacuolar-type H+-ATPase subunit H
MNSMSLLRLWLRRLSASEAAAAAGGRLRATLAPATPPAPAPAAATLLPPRSTLAEAARPWQALAASASEVATNHGQAADIFSLAIFGSVGASLIVLVTFGSALFGAGAFATSLLTNKKSEMAALKEKVDFAEKGIKVLKEGAEKGIKEAKECAEKGIKEVKEGAEKGIKEAKEGAEKGIKEAKECAEKGIKEAKEGAPRPSRPT